MFIHLSFQKISFTLIIYAISLENLIKIPSEKILRQCQVHCIPVDAQEVPSYFETIVSSFVCPFDILKSIREIVLSMYRSKNLQM